MRRLAIYILILILGLSISLPLTEATEGRSSGSLRGASSSISHLRLKGTLFTRSLTPLAIIEDARTNQVTMHEIGDIIEGGLKIIHIARGEVILEALKGQLKLSFPEGAIWQPGPSAAEDKNWYNIRKEGDTFVTDEATVSNAIRRAAEIMRNVKVKPCFMNGKPSGVRVTRFTPIGVLKEVGVKEGDVIKSINGHNLNTPHQIFTAYRKLRNQQELKVDIIRNNQPLVLSYQIRRR